MARNVLKKAALMVMASGGVVRRFEHAGEQQLAYKMRKNHEWFNRGRQWSMVFDANPQLIRRMEAEMHRDPAVIRHGIMKLSVNSRHIV